MANQLEKNKHLPLATLKRRFRNEKKKRRDQIKFNKDVMFK